MAYVPFSLMNSLAGTSIDHQWASLAFILAPISEHRPGDYPVHARGLNLLAGRSLSRRSWTRIHPCLDELRLALLRLEGTS